MYTPPTPHKNHESLVIELEKASRLVKIGGTYSHYKNPKNLYKVLTLGVQEATDNICVIYQAEYDKKLIFVRDLDSWLEKVEKEGKLIERFKMHEN